MPSSASSTTLERSSSLPTFTDASHSLSLNSSRSSILAEPPIAQCHNDFDIDNIIFGASSTTPEACQKATAQLAVAKRLLSSAKLYNSKADALLAVRTFGDSLASLLRLRSSSPNNCDISAYLHQSVIAHVSEILSGDNHDISLISSSTDANGPHTNFADSLIQALEGLQDSVNLCKSSFNPGPVVNHHYQEKTLDDPHHSSRDCGNTRRTFTSQEDDGLVNLMTEREFWLNFQATQEQSLNYAHAICTLLLSALSDLDDSRLKSQVSSLANDVVLKTPFILSVPRVVHDLHSHSDQNENKDDLGQVTRPRHSLPMQIPRQTEFSAPPSTNFRAPIAAPLGPAFTPEMPHDHPPSNDIHSSPDIGHHCLRPTSDTVSSRHDQPHHHGRYHRRQSQDDAPKAQQTRSRSQSLLTLALAFASITAPKAHDCDHLGAMTSTTTTTTTNPTAPPSPVATVRSALSMFSKFPVRRHTTSFSSSDVTAFVPGKPTPTLKYDVSRKSSLDPAQVVPASTSAMENAVDEDEQTKWMPVRYRTISMPSGGRSSESGKSGDVFPARPVDAKMNVASGKPCASAKDLLFAVQSRAGTAPARVREPVPAAKSSPVLNSADIGDAGASFGILSRIRTRALSWAPPYNPFASSSSAFLPPSSREDDDPSATGTSQNEGQVQTTSPTSSSPTLLVTSPSSSPTRSFYVSQILTPSANRGGRKTHTIATIPRRSSTSNNRPLPFRAHTLASGACIPGPSNGNGKANSASDGPMPPLHPALAAVERSSRLLKQSIRCAACGDVGKDFPRCGKCGEAWCSRECRVKSLAGKKRHVCAVNTPSPVDGSAPASASIAIRNCSPPIHATTPTIPIPTPFPAPHHLHPPRPVDGVYPRSRQNQNLPIAVHVMS